MALAITITPTDQVTAIEGVPVRAWVGKTSEGIVCHVFVHRIAVAAEEDTAEFDEALREMPEPTRFVDLWRIL